MRVALAIITDSLNRILITQRPLHVSHGGCWEFPGGKIEADESPEQALLREIKEEIGIEIQEYHFIGDVSHSYPDKSVQLIAFLVTQFSGTPSCLEGQLELKWVKKESLRIEDFPEANRALLNLIPMEEIV
jgi:8-oxo-dGTP diphosphatase